MSKTHVYCGVSCLIVNKGFDMSKTHVYCGVSCLIVNKGFDIGGRGAELLLAHTDVYTALMLASSVVASAVELP